MDQGQHFSTPQNEQQDMLLGVLSYLGPLVIISLIIGKENPFIKYHVKQGLVLLVVEVAVWLLASMMWQFWMIWQLVNLGTFVLAILGIVNVVQKKEAPLPLIGSFSSYFTF